MDRSSLILQQRADHLDRPAAAGKDVAAGQAQGFVIGVAAAGHSIQALLAQSKNYPAYLAPMNGPGTHGARFRAGVEGAATECLRIELL